MESTTNANQKEKFEGDLKKEIKKLQVICVILFSLFQCEYRWRRNTCSTFVLGNVEDIWPV